MQVIVTMVRSMQQELKAAAIAALAFLLAGQAEAAALTPHRAVYDLHLLKAGQSSSLAGADGRMVFEVMGSACEGWTVSFRMVNRFRPNEGEFRVVDTQSTSFESGDALDFRFNEREFVNSKLQGETKIKVTRGKPESEGAGLISGEGENSFVAPAGAFFPVQHQLKLMNLAEAGETRDSSTVYDGSSGKDSYRAISFIGKRKEAGSNSRDNANASAKVLASAPSWPISISYYPQTAGDQDTPAYQVSFDLYENGVATGLNLDYGNFTLGGDLTNLELLPKGECGQ